VSEPNLPPSSTQNNPPRPPTGFEEKLLACGFGQTSKFLYGTCPFCGVDEVRAYRSSGLWITRCCDKSGKAPELIAALGATAGKRLDSVTPERVEMLWHGRLALRKLSTVSGDPGEGKSVATMDFASRVTRGLPFPDADTAQIPPRNVVLAVAEDGLADTVLPRILAAGGDPARIFAVGTVEKPLTLDPDGLRKLREAIVLHEAALVVIDPLDSHLPDGVDPNKSVQIRRRALGPLATIAAETGAAILVVRHLSKAADGRSAIYREMGSISISGAARTTMLVARDPEDQERRVLAVVKTNLSRKPTSLTFRLRETVEGVPFVEWLGVSDAVADDLVQSPADDRAPGARQDAKSFLERLLSNGPVLTTMIEAAAEEAGMAWRTVQRGKDDLGILAEKTGFDGGWSWRLPAAPQEPNGIADPGQAPAASRSEGCQS
jgi:hypothetical protein